MTGVKQHVGAFWRALALGQGQGAEAHNCLAPGGAVVVNRDWLDGAFGTLVVSQCRWADSEEEGWVHFVLPLRLCASSGNSGNRSLSVAWSTR